MALNGILDGVKASAVDKKHFINAEELDRIYAFAIQLSKDAGDLLLKALEEKRARAESSDSSTGKESTGIEQEEQWQEKMNSVDIVTKTDNEVEQFIHNKIIMNYPQHAFIGEETYSRGSSKEYLVTNAPTWIVDPLDGTVNFTHGFPMFCISIALTLNQNPIIGVIYAPLLNQLFTACKGKGAWLNERTRLPLLGKAVGPIPNECPGKCIFSCEWGKDRRDKPEGNMYRKAESFLNMACEKGGRGGQGGMVHGVRSLGSATLDLAYTAMGSFDLWWEGGCWEWDVAAGIALLQEAGGLVTVGTPPPDFKGTGSEISEVPDVRLGSRLYLGIRPATDKPGETAKQGQIRAVKEVWKRVVGLDYSRPGG